MSKTNVRIPESVRNASRDEQARFVLDEFRHHLHVGESDLIARPPSQRRIDDEIAELEGRIDDVEHALWMTMLNIESNSGEGGDISAALRELRRLRAERAELRARLENVSRAAADRRYTVA